MAARLVAIAVPWLALIWPAGVVSVALYALAIAAAFHGYGLAIARLCRRDPGAWLAMWWGLAAVVALAGVVLAVGAYTPRVQWLLVFAGVAIHSVLVALRGASLPARSTLVPALLIAAIGIIHVVGGAGDVGARPFDDDGNLLGQLERLADTGALADGIGYPRTSQLGGNVALGSLAAIAGDLRFVRMLDGLGLVLFLGLACARIGIRNATSGVWAALLVLAASSLAVVQIDPSPFWLLAGFALALFATVEDTTDDPRSALPAALLAGAMIAMRTELAPIAIVGIAGAWWERSGRMLALLAGIAAVVVAPYAIARHLADPISASASGWSLVRAAGFVAISIPAAVLLLLPFGDDRTRAQRTTAWATAATLAGIAVQLTGDRAYAAHMLWPIGFAYIAKLIVELTRTDTRAPLAASLVVALLASAWIYEGRESPGRPRWSRRYSELVSGVEYLHHIGDAAPAGGRYDRAFAAIPAGASVAIWVARPEQLDYAAHRIVDLRTPRWAQLRKRGDVGHEFAALIAKTGAEYLVVERDDVPVSRAQQDLVYRALCIDVTTDLCADDLEIALRDRPLVTADGLVRVVKL